MRPPDRLPCEVIVDILLRLPAKVLARYRSVSKLWRFLIDDPKFIELHLKHSGKISSNLSLIIKSWYLYIADFDSLSVATEIKHPLNEVRGGTEAFGSCNGLIGVCNSEKDIALWNPSTGMYQKLAVAAYELPGDIEICRYTFYGFGHDPVSDDYKVVRMIQFASENGDLFSAQVKVFSLKSNSWREIKGFPDYVRYMFQPYYYLFYRRGYGTFAGGALHWVAPAVLESPSTNLIVAFDLKLERFGLVQQPDRSNGIFQLDVGVLDGCLCMSCNYQNDYVDVWVMKEYGVRDSWTNLFKITQTDVRGFSGFVMPLAYGKSCDMVLMEVDDGKLVWFDRKRRKSKKVRIEGAPGTFSAEVYVGSLIPLPGGGIDRKKQAAEEKNKNKNARKKRDDFLSEGFKLVL
ncbi:F-box protein CPR1 [Malania oleifera]|uniref:F-box protein CPR1 n=1 Tax=Malania oleifera TaxID=397392 RepID=UPI0025ADB047|nr:F-box protein CPR1 [Malania oleifera]